MGRFQITSCLSADGEKILILGVEAEYPMKDGGKSELLVVGFSMEDLEKALVTQEENALVYTHIIEEDGSFVVRTGYDGWSNYYDYIQAYFLMCKLHGDYNGKRGRYRG